MLAKTFERQGNFLSAVQLLEKKKQILPEASDLLHLYQDIGKCYFRLQQYEQSLPYLQACMHICVTRPNTELVRLHVANYMSLIYMEQQRYKDALSCCEKNLTLAKQINSIPHQAQALSQISNIYLLLSNLQAKNDNLYAEKSLYYQKLAMALLKMQQV